MHATAYINGRMAVDLLALARAYHVADPEFSASLPEAGGAAASMPEAGGPAASVVAVAQEEKEEDEIVDGWKRMKTTDGRVRWSKWIGGERIRSANPSMKMTKEAAAATARCRFLQNAKRRSEYKFAEHTNATVNDRRSKTEWTMDQNIWLKMTAKIKQQ